MRGAAQLVGSSTSERHVFHNCIALAAIFLLVAVIFFYGQEVGVANYLEATPAHRSGQPRERSLRYYIPHRK
jgi:hypothetical protein